MSVMEGHSRNNLIKRLVSGLPRDLPFDLRDLESLGVSRQAASHYVRAGWLERLGHGVYAFPGTVPSSEGLLLLLQRRVTGLRVGGKTALRMHGVGHNLSVRERLVLWGDERASLPGWFTAYQSARYVSASLFDWEDSSLAPATMMTPPGVREGVRVSAPERAVLEMLYDAGTRETLEEARAVFDGLRTLRQGLMGTLLSCCTSVKAVRLFLTWAEETEVVDVGLLLEESSPRTGGGRRWVQRLSDGTLLTLQPYGQEIR